MNFLQHLLYPRVSEHMMDLMKFHSRVWGTDRFTRDPGNVVSQNYQFLFLEIVWVIVSYYFVLRAFCT